MKHPETVTLWLASVGTAAAIQVFAATALAQSEAATLDQVAENYVHLTLQLQNHDMNPYIYLADKAWQAEAQATPLPLPDVVAGLADLQAALADIPAPEGEHGALRKSILNNRVTAALTRAQTLNGNPPASFAEETTKLFNVVAPEYDEAHYRELAARLDDLIPGEGPLTERMDAFRTEFRLPSDKIGPAIQAAIDACRERTKQFIDLPENENLTIKIIEEGTFSGFAQYMGDSQSVILINKAVPIYVEQALHLGCHEGYPGHHVQGTLTEAVLVKERGWLEYAILPLHGAHGFIAEGGANFGHELAFDRDEQIAFARDVVLPIAGLEHMADELERYQSYVDLSRDLSYARNDTARLYLYGGYTRDEALNWLVENGLESRARAEQRMAFIDALRSYVINYSYGTDWVRAFVEDAAPQSEAERWQLLRRIIVEPVVPLGNDG